MGDLAGILVIDDFMGDGVCVIGRASLALNVELWPLWTKY